MRITKQQEPFAWPPWCHLRFYSKDNRGRLRLELESKSRLFDLADNVTPSPPQKTWTIYLGLTARSSRWRTWSIANVEKVEWRIRYDLHFDAHSVSIRRLTPIKDQPCSEEFLWKLVIGVEGSACDCS